MTITVLASLVLCFLAKRFKTTNGENEKDEIHTLSEQNTEREKDSLFARLFRVKTKRK